MRRLAVKALLALVALAAGVCVAGYAVLRRSLPLVDGAVSVPGISSPVDIVRDADAIPHIYASTKLDALFGLGYAHAQDRLWQMEFQRRIGHGRLSEIFGAATIPQDRFLRTVGFGRAARAGWERMPAWAKQEVNAYVAGVNAFIGTHHGTQLPPEFTLLRFEPEPWDGADVNVWVKMLAWDLSKNYTFELLRADIARTVGAEGIDELMPPYADGGLNILSSRDLTWLKRKADPSQAPAAPAIARAPTTADAPARSGSFAAMVASLSQGNPSVRDLLLGGPTSDALGSNNWVVDGTLSATGLPLLANDPHLGAQVPSLWYLAHVKAGDFESVGATVPGAPAIAIGRNRFIAWGETNLAADVEDLFRERIDPSGRFAEFRGQPEALTMIPETIRVKGRAPLTMSVRISRHGPLISDAINANNAELRRSLKPAPLEPLAFRWTALDADDTTLPSFLQLMEARNWSDYTAALRSFVVPPQNFIYGDVYGHIGYYATGRLPVRAHGDGSVPSEGWSGENEWTGSVPFDELPHTFDPPEHFIVTANNRPAPPTYPRVLGGEWTDPYRAQRIVDLLTQKLKLTPDDFAAIQADTLSLHAKSLLPLLLVRVKAQSTADEQALALLRTWDYDARGDSVAPAIFQAWLFELTPALAGNDLGPLIVADYIEQDRLSYVARFLARALARPDGRWCDDRRTPQHDTCGDAVSKALHTGVATLTRQFGGDMTRWRWDDVHHAVFPHLGLDSVPVLRLFLSRSMPHGGDWSTVNVGTVAAKRPFEEHSIPSYRQIIDLSPANDSRFIDAVGESGHPLSPHYDDFLRDWQRVKHRRMRMERADVERDALGRLHLTPR